MKYLTFLLRVCIGIIFIYSAYTKLFPVELFEYTFADTGFISWQLAPFVARLFIGLEFLLGAWLLLGIAPEKFTLKATIALLLFFCIYLLNQILVKKESGNCGCFGTAIIMTPAQALIKNIVLLISTAALYYFPQSFILQKKSTLNLVATATLAAAFLLPFTLNPPNYLNSATFAPKKVNYRPPLELLYAQEQADKPTVDVTKGKWIVAFLSLTCEHCKLAAFKLNVMHKKNPELPVLFILNGDKKDLAGFYKVSNAQDVPHHFFMGKEPFLKLVGPSFPVIFWLNNGVVEKKTNHMNTEQAEIEAWLKVQ